MLDVRIGVTIDLNDNLTRPEVNIFVLTVDGDDHPREGASANVLRVPVHPGQLQKHRGRHRQRQRQHRRRHGAQGGGGPPGPRRQPRAEPGSCPTYVNEQLDPADLADGPLSNLNVDLPGDLGFKLLGGRYVQTGPGGDAGGEVGHLARGRRPGRQLHGLRPGRLAVPVQRPDRRRPGRLPTARTAAAGPTVSSSTSVSSSTARPSTSCARALTAGKPVQQPDGRWVDVGCSISSDPALGSRHPPVGPAALPAHRAARMAGDRPR